MKRTLAYLSCIFAIGVCVPVNVRPKRDAVSPQKYFIWNVEQFPNPQTDFEQCNRSGTSFVCNPDHILDEQDAKKIDFIISKIKNETPCACSDCSTTPGITIGVAVFRNMFHKYPDIIQDSSQEFAKNLLTKWKLGTCGDAILVLLAIGNEQFTVVTGDSVAKVLHPTDLQAIISGVTEHFISGSIYQGLESLLQSIYDRLKGIQNAPGYMGDTDETGRSQVGLTVGLTIGLIALVALLVGGFVFMRHKRRSHFAEKQEQVKRTSSRGSSIVKTPVIFSDAVYQPCSVEDPAGNYGNRHTSDEELNFEEYSAVPLKQKADEHDSPEIRRELSSVEEKEDEDDNSSDKVEYRHPKMKNNTPKV